MNSIKQEILIYLEESGKYEFAGRIEDHIRTLMGAKASNASRRMRELYTEGKIEKQYVKVEGVGNPVVQYKIIPASEPIPESIPTRQPNHEQAQLLL